MKKKHSFLFLGLAFTLLLTSCNKPVNQDAQRKPSVGSAKADELSRKEEVKPPSTADQKASEEDVSAPEVIAGAPDKAKLATGYTDFESEGTSYLKDWGDYCSPQNCTSDESGNLEEAFVKACEDQGFLVLKINCCGGRVCSGLPKKE